MSVQGLDRGIQDYLVPPNISADIVDASAYAGDKRVERGLKWLRANNPVGWVDVQGYDPFWIVTKHADILKISRQHDLFHSGDRTIIFMDSASVKRNLELKGTAKLQNSILFFDNPEHQNYRAIAQSWFMPQQVAKREERIRRIAKSTVAHMLSKKGECDFVEDVALRYPLRVIMEILGAPQEDEAVILKLTRELIGIQDPDKGRGDAATYADAYSDVVADFKSYLRKIMIARRHSPTDDVATVIALGKVNGNLLDEDSVLDYYIAFATAGHDTTSSSTAGAIWALANHPEEFAKVKNNPSLIPLLVDEAIRWTTPVQHFMRSATADYVLRSRTIKKGDWVMLSYLSGNQDEEVFADPAFHVDRTPNPHLSFGHGIHLCLGMHLTKLEMRILFEELLPHLDSLELAGEPTRTESGFISGPKFLPIRFQVR